MQIKKLIELFEKFLNNNDSLNEQELESLKELWAFYNVKVHLNRLACATFICNTLKKLM
ncbi:hypothetical protein [Mycoplasmopsis alligatoris]|uniref:Uncharacterized protein n=1 Tax=Mycoplasmopsis alligatoris A21JP2 TaxID=747682 RepID=D4XW20_9BACT|nr:hypothetical protein [Mycoplasmopsis alligatoris]EFF41459.1 conserved hypothetical protein [Mycoplasmopsis alligatoris A21JP2]